jgi:hypothetical protein
VLFTVARALKRLPACLVQAGRHSLSSCITNVQRLMEIRLIICCTGSVCVMLLVGFHISELTVYINNCLIVVVVPYNSKLIYSTATCFQHFS